MAVLYIKVDSMTCSTVTLVPAMAPPSPRDVLLRNVVPLTMSVALWTVMAPPWPPPLFVNVESSTLMMAESLPYKAPAAELLHEMNDELTTAARDPANATAARPM